MVLTLIFYFEDFWKFSIWLIFHSSLGKCFSLDGDRLTLFSTSVGKEINFCDRIRVKLLRHKQSTSTSFLGLEIGLRAKEILYYCWKCFIDVDLLIPNIAKHIGCGKFLCTFIQILAEVTRRCPGNKISCKWQWSHCQNSQKNLIGERRIKINIKTQNKI